VEKSSKFFENCELTTIKKEKVRLKEARKQEILRKLTETRNTAQKK
jgi:hypothetical protein